jgi:23S rRNA A2030 N6-methylase RlmJ
VPPNERRGLVLIDPPFESRDEFARLDGFSAAHAKWPTGIFLLWYPGKTAVDLPGGSCGACGERRQQRRTMLAC